MATAHSKIKIRFKSTNEEEFIVKNGKDFTKNQVFVKTRKPMAVGSPIEIDFRLSDDKEFFASKGVVKWSRTKVTADGPPGMAISLDELSDASKSILHAILDDKGKTDSESFLTPTKVQNNDEESSETASGVKDNTEDATLKPNTPETVTSNNSVDPTSEKTETKADKRHNTEPFGSASSAAISDQAPTSTEESSQALAAQSSASLTPDLHFKGDTNKTSEPLPTALQESYSLKDRDKARDILSKNIETFSEEKRFQAPPKLASEEAFAETVPATAIRDKSPSSSADQKSTQAIQPAKGFPIMAVVGFLFVLFFLGALGIALMQKNFQ